MLLDCQGDAGGLLIAAMAVVVVAVFERRDQVALELDDLAFDPRARGVDVHETGQQFAQAGEMGQDWVCASGAAVGSTGSPVPS